MNKQNIPDLVFTDRKQITVLPVIIRKSLKEYFEKNGIEYRVVSQDDFPDGTPGGCTFLGKPRINGVFGMETFIEPASLHDFAEQFFSSSHDLLEE